jgi:thioesterase domain-containing protein
MNEYGPTETVVGCSAYVLPTGKHRAGPVPVGHPIQNIRFYLLDTHLEPLPVRLPGELYIGGAGVARGYLGRPGLTAERFVPDPFADAGERMYRTGDRARWLHDGNLMILGRTDSQVKVRGYRVELGEVEAALRRHPEVSECLVVVREDRPGDRRLIAYLVASAGAADRVLREFLRRGLPEYMVPDAFVRLDALPQTSTGKLDRRTLPPPEYGGTESESEAPCNETEVQLIRIWEALLGVDGISPTENFFELGGNSFLALRLLAQVNRALGCSLQVSTLFAGATVRRLAEAVLREQSPAAALEPAIVRLQPDGWLPPLFCVHSSDRRVLGWVGLARHLGPNQPVFGVQDVGDDLSRPLDRIAAEHVRAVRELQPEGPYYLAGWSFGGFLVYEMASQLERQGQAVAFVGVGDAMSPLLAQERLGYDPLKLLVGVASDVAEHSGVTLGVGTEDLEGLHPDEQLRRVIEALQARGAAPAGFDAAALRANCEVIRDRTTSLFGYVPGGFSGTLTLFRAETVRDDYERFFAARTDEEKHTLGWCRISPRAVEVHVLPGTHNTIGTEPHVRVFAERVREALALARSRAGGGFPAPEATR